MFFQNDSARSVIPDWSCEKDEHDQTPDDSGGNGHPGQERHQDGRNGSCFATSLIVSAPNAKPPMCANTATPAVDWGAKRPRPPSIACSRNQIPRKTIAGISQRKKKKPRKTAVSTRARGRSRKYAPSTAAIAPLAPMFGMLASAAPPNCSVTKVCNAVAATPPRRYQTRKRTLPSASSTLFPKIQRKSMLPRMWIQLACMNIELKTVSTSSWWWRAMPTQGPSTSQG